jgi:hypothetical protein
MCIDPKIHECDSREQALEVASRVADIYIKNLGWKTDVTDKEADRVIIITTTTPGNLIKTNKVTW